MQETQTLNPRVPFFKNLRRTLGKAFWGYLFIFPSLLIILVFKLLPVLVGLYVSMTNWTVLSSPKFIGFDNYTRLLSDPLVPKVMGNTFYYSALSVPLNILLSLGIAIALNQRIKGMSFFRTAFYIPVVTASVAVSMIWVWLLSDFGIINTLLISLKMTPINFLNNPQLSLTMVTLVDVWKNLGFNIIIFLAALQDVPEEIRDAAKVDGASKWNVFRHVTLPMISPALFFTTVMGIIGSLQAFDLVYNMSLRHEGGPARSTSTIGFYIWQNAFRYNKMGYAAALAFGLMLILLVFTLVQWKFRKKWVYGEEE
ncbi:MAG: sugar ABC transporter permease [Anaerolineaceae bacterium]|nr:sugar ABC transporter permease [Anaerolineaceae bacterium]